MVIFEILSEKGHFVELKSQLKIKKNKKRRKIKLTIKLWWIECIDCKILESKFLATSKVRGICD